MSLQYYNWCSMLSNPSDSRARHGTSGYIVREYYLWNRSLSGPHQPMSICCAPSETTSYSRLTVWTERFLRGVTATWDGDGDGMGQANRPVADVQVYESFEMQMVPFGKFP